MKEKNNNFQIRDEELKDKEVYKEKLNLRTK